jgi:hypothetical protein
LLVRALGREERRSSALGPADIPVAAAPKQESLDDGRPALPCSAVLPVRVRDAGVPVRRSDYGASRRADGAVAAALQLRRGSRL